MVESGGAHRLGPSPASRRRSGYLIGEDAFARERTWQTAYRATFQHGRKGNTIAALSWLDIALWDLAGKALGAPVYKLLGAAHDSMPAYGSAGFYAEGKGRKPITAFLAGSGLKAPGSPFSCANCHLGEGAGTKEGGVQAADITLATLSADRPGVRPSGRAHPAYTDEGLRNAVLGGFDPGGNTCTKLIPVTRSPRRTWSTWSPISRFWVGSRCRASPPPYYW